MSWLESFNENANELHSTPTDVSLLRNNDRKMENKQTIEEHSLSNSGYDLPLWYYLVLFDQQIHSQAKFAHSRKLLEKIPVSLYV